MDHKPLLTIFGPISEITVMAVSRLQRWAIILSAYTYNIQYKLTKEHGNADTLSRFPVTNDDCFEKEQSLELVVNLVQTSQLEKLPIQAKDIQKATKEDKVFQKYMNISRRVGLLAKRIFQKNYSHIFRSNFN